MYTSNLKRSCQMILNVGTLGALLTSLQAAAPERFFVDYHYWPQVGHFRVCDFGILCPYSSVDLNEVHALGKKAYAYISMGAIADDAPYAADADWAGVPYLGFDPAWNTKIVNVSSPIWNSFVLDVLVRRMAEKPWDGFFLDTLDSYALTGTWAQPQEEGLVRLIRDLKAAYPDKKIILNNGLALFDRVQDAVDGVMIEGLFFGYGGLPTSSSQTYRWAQVLNRIKNAGKGAYVLDYQPDGSVSAAEALAQRITELGFSPLIVQRSLDGTILAPMPLPQIDSISFKDGQAVLTFNAFAGRRYQVEASESARSNEWHVVTGIEPASNTRPVQVIDSTSPPGHYIYRLRSDY